MEEKFNRKISCLSMRLEEKLNRKNPSLSMRFEEKLNRKSYQAGESYYQLLEEVGYGVSATVYRAKYLPANEVVAVKCLDLDRCNSNLDDIRREAQTMSLIDHPTVIRAHCSFVVDRCLWVVMPFMAGGSCLHIMKSAYPNGFEEPIIARILKEILKALDYLHCQGHIHRDVKAGNILIDATGVVKLGDFGVSACMFDKGNRQWSRNTFVGTPCWMAPEVLQPGKGYDFKADIWSFGITALELAHGHAPFSKYPPMKVLLMTIQNASPGLDYQRDKKFSKSFKEMTAMCLVKDPTKRPTAEKLLRHSFFKHTKSSEYVAYNLLHGLPPLWDRVKALQLKDAAQLALKELPSTEEELRSQNEYKQGVSAWNFDIDDLKAQAALIQDDDRELEEREEDALFRESMKDNNNCCHSFCSPQTSISSNSEMVQSSGMAGPRTTDSSEAQSELKPALQKSATITDLGKLDKESRQSTWEEAYRNHLHKENAFNGPLLLPKRASTNSLLAPPRSSGGVRTNASVIQKKGRFSVTSTDIDFVESPPFRESASVNNSDSDENQTVIAQLPKDTINTGSVPVDVLIPHLQTLLQQTVSQQEHIVSLLSSLHKKDATTAAYQYAKCPSQFLNGESGISVETTTEREQILHSKIAELQAKILSLTDESRAVKARNIQLQQQLIAIYHQEEEDKIQKEERVKDP